MLLEKGRDLPDRLFPRLGDVEMDADADPLSQSHLAAGPRPRFLERPDRALLHGRGPASDETPDAVLHHEIEAPRLGAHHRLPALDGGVQGPRNEADLLQIVAPVGHLGRQFIVFALVREGFLGEGLENDFDLLLEKFAIGVLIQ